MALYRKIKGQDTKVADNSIIDHSQLTGRDAYGAHPISAIRKLPEKLTLLKNGKVDKDQIANEEIAGIVWAWQDLKDGKPIFHIWTHQPGPQPIPEPIIDDNPAGGLTYTFAANTPCEIEENIAGGLTYQFGGNN